MNARPWPPTVASSIDPVVVFPMPDNGIPPACAAVTDGSRRVADVSTARSRNAAICLLGLIGSFTLPKASDSGPFLDRTGSDALRASAPPRAVRFSRISMR